tara:strand:+ start:135 stop:944 length:810 start_codon:yes stop_codon:yes gene_type:complete
MKPIKNNLTAKRLFGDFMDVLEMRRGIIKTLYYLSFNPKYVISNYIEDRRGDFSGPIRVFYICFIAWALMMFTDGWKFESDNIHFSVAKYYDMIWNDDNGYYTLETESKEELGRIKKISDICHSLAIHINPLYTLPFTLIPFSLFTFLLTREYFKTFLEHLCANLYLISAILIIRFLSVAVYLTIYEDGSMWDDVFINGSIIYCLYLTWRVFDWKNKILKCALVLVISWYNPVTISWEAENFNIYFMPLNSMSYHILNSIYMPILDFFF